MVLVEPRPQGISSYPTLRILSITTYSTKIQIRDIISEILFVMFTDC